MKKPHAVLASVMLGALASAAQADVVVVVSAKSAASTLTKDQVSDIFLGKAATFLAVAGPGGTSIDLAPGAMRPPSSSTRRSRVVRRSS